MSKKKYRISMSVPLGTRNGTMFLQQSDNRLTGWLNILGKENAFSGVVSSNGQIKFSGVLQTFLSTIPYTATGRVNRSQLRISLKTASGAYYLLSGEELNPDENVL